MNSPQPDQISEAYCPPAVSVIGGIDCADQQHAAHALYLLHRAIALMETGGEENSPTIHAALRDAASHCEAARKHWTKEAMVRRAEIRAKLGFEEDAVVA